jgi:hypothetical protein
MRFHYIGQVFDARQDAAQLGEVFHFDDQVQVCDAAADVHRYIDDVDVFIRKQVEISPIKPWRSYALILTGTGKVRSTVSPVHL